MNGFVKDVELELKKHDIFLNFSESDSCSLTCLDALFFVTLLIASDCGGPAELFVNGRSGFLVPNRDINAMAEAILNLASDENKRRQFSLSGRSYVREKFKAENTYLKLKCLYQKFISINELNNVNIR